MCNLRNDLFLIDGSVFVFIEGLPDRKMLSMSKKSWRLRKAKLLRKKFLTKRKSNGRMSPSIFLFISVHLLVSISSLPCSQNGRRTFGVSFSMSNKFSSGVFIDFYFSSSSSFSVVIIMAVCNLSVCIGVHRLWSHRSFKVTRPLKLFLLFFYTMAGQVRKVKKKILSGNNFCARVIS